MYYCVACSTTIYMGLLKRIKLRHSMRDGSNRRLTLRAGLSYQIFQKKFQIDEFQRELLQFCSPSVVIFTRILFNDGNPWRQWGKKAYSLYKASIDQLPFRALWVKLRNRDGINGIKVRKLPSEGLYTPRKIIRGRSFSQHCLQQVRSVRVCCTLSA